MKMGTRVSGRCFDSLLLVITMFVVSGCSTVAKAYPGAERPRGQIAVLMVPYKVRVETVNGQKGDYYNRLTYGGGAEIHLAPGLNTVQLWYWDHGEFTDIYSRNNLLVKFEAKAGRVYRINPGVLGVEKEGILGIGRRGYVIWSPTVEDITGKSEQ